MSFIVYSDDRARGQAGVSTATSQSSEVVPFPHSKSQVHSYSLSVYCKLILLREVVYKLDPQMGCGILKKKEKKNVLERLHGSCGERKVDSSASRCYEIIQLFDSDFISESFGSAE